MKHTRILLLIALLAAAAVGLPSLNGATITVINTNDNGPGSLRQAVTDALAGDTINFHSSLNGQRITLTSGELLVNKSVAISGSGANTLAVDANHASRVFYIAPGKDVTISGLTITNGLAPNSLGGGIYSDRGILTLSSCTISGNSAFQGAGGGILNDHGILTVSNSTVSGNSCWTGGGICNSGGGSNGSATATITNSTISGNSGSSGGGIYNQYTNLTVSNSTISGNSVEYTGGGIYNAGFNLSAISTLAITNSTFSGNSASSGGGIHNDFAGTATMTNCTFSGNSAGGNPNVIYDGSGAGIWNAQTLTVTNSTFSGNSATNHGGGIYNNGMNGYATTILKIGDTILNAGPSGENIYNDNNYYPAMVTSLGYNLSSDNGGGLLTATGDQINTNPRLGPLQNNGGPHLNPSAGIK